MAQCIGGGAIPIQAPQLYVLNPKSVGAMVTVSDELLSMTGSTKMCVTEL